MGAISLEAALAIFRNAAFLTGDALKMLGQHRWSLKKQLNVKKYIYIKLTRLMHLFLISFPPLSDALKLYYGNLSKWWLGVGISKAFEGYKEP